MSVLQEALRLPRERVRRAWRGSPLPGFFAWWRGELGFLLPASWRALFAGGAQWHLLERQSHGWSLRRDGQATVLAEVDDEQAVEIQLATLRQAMAQVDREDLRVALCLPASDVLCRQLHLPLAARDNVRQVAAYEMDRQTPFRVEQVRYGVRETTTRASAGKFVAYLAVVPRTQLDPLLARLHDLGMGIDAVDVAEGNGRLGVDLLPSEHATRRANPRQRLNLILAAATVALVLIGMGTWIHNRQAALEAMQADVENMRGDAQRVAALRQRLSDSAGAAGFLAQRKSAAVPVLAVLEELTRRLPDDTWLERLTVDNTGQLGFQGQSPQAARLVDTLKGTTLFGEPSFQGTIQTDPTSGKERFYMVAKVHTAAKETARAPQAR
jgi:general secretion pathway protein L